MGRTRSTDWTLDEASFNRLLEWLNPDRDRAGDCYEDIRSRLITMFTYRGRQDAEDLADETINRVTRRLPEKEYEYIKTPLPIFFGFAKRVLQEHFKPHPFPTIPVIDPSADAKDAEDRDKCWRECLDELPIQQRQMMLEYHREEKSQVRVLIRRELARRLGMTIGALRIRVSRIQDDLEECRDACLEKAQAEPLMAF